MAEDIIALWPSSLPIDPLLDGYSERAFMPKASFQSEIGPPIERGLTSVRLEKAQVSYDMTDEQYETFRDFVWYDLARGVLRFTIPHPRKQESIEAKIAGESEPYQVQKMSPGYWKVSFELWLWV